MALTHGRVAVGITATRLDTPVEPAVDPWPGEVVRVQLPAAATAPVFLGAAGVTTTSYGHELTPSSHVELRLSPDDGLFAVAAAVGQTVNVLRYQA